MRQDFSPQKQAMTALLIGLIAAALAFMITNDFYLRILFSIATYFLCAAGMNVLLGYAGQKSLGQAGLFAAGQHAAGLFDIVA